MPIINEIDEENPKNNRTIDTDTGVYLKYVEANGWDRIAIFDIVDGETKIKIYADFSNKIDEEKKINHISYEASIDPLGGLPRRDHYADLIRRLFEVHGWRCRADERKFGNEEQVLFNFKPQDLVNLKNWEISYGN